MKTILEVMTNHLGEFHDIDDVRAGTVHNLKAIDVYNMLKEYGEEVVDQCAAKAKQLAFPGTEAMIEAIIIMKIKKQIK